MIPWTCGAAHRHTTSPISALGLYHVARELLISRPAEGSKLSWPKHAVGQQLAQGCLQMAYSHLHHESYESDTALLDHLHLERHMGEQFAQSRYSAMCQPGVEPVTSQSQVQCPNHFTSEPPSGQKVL